MTKVSPTRTTASVPLTVCKRASSSSVCQSSKVNCGRRSVLGCHAKGYSVCNVGCGDISVVSSKSSGRRVSSNSTKSKVFLQNAVSTPQYTGQNLVVEGLQIKKPASHMPRYAQRVGGNLRKYKSLSVSLKRSLSESFLISPDSNTTTRSSMRTSASATNHVILKPPSTSSSSRDSRARPSRVQSSKYKALTERPPFSNSKRLLSSVTFSKTSRSPKTTAFAKSVNTARTPNVVKTIDMQFRPFSRSDRGKVMGTIGTVGRPKSAFSLPKNIPVINTVANKKFQHSTPRIVLKPWQQFYNASCLKPSLVAPCNYYILEKLPKLHAQNAIVTIDVMEKVLRKMLVLTPKVISHQKPSSEELKCVKNYPTSDKIFGNQSLTNEESELSSEVSSTRSSYSTDCSSSYTQDSLKSYSFNTPMGLRGVLKDSSRSQDASTLYKSVVFRSPLQSTREASFDESSSTLIDGNSGGDLSNISFFASKSDAENTIHQRCSRVKDKLQAVEAWRQLNLANKYPENAIDVSLSFDENRFVETEDGVFLINGKNLIPKCRTLSPKLTKNRREKSMFKADVIDSAKSCNHFLLSDRSLSSLACEHCGINDILASTAGRAQSLGNNLWANQSSFVNNYNNSSSRRVPLLRLPSEIGSRLTQHGDMITNRPTSGPSTDSCSSSMARNR